MATARHETSSSLQSVDLCCNWRSRFCWDFGLSANLQVQIYEGRCTRCFVFPLMATGTIVLVVGNFDVFCRYRAEYD